mgnify:CR=1 FL=1
MVKRKTGLPFQEGYLFKGTSEIHIFTDYRWNHGKVTRRWLVDPETITAEDIVTHPFSVSPPPTDD